MRSAGNSSFTSAKRFADRLGASLWLVSTYAPAARSGQGYSEKGRIEALQVIRGIAAVSVVLFHAEFMFGPDALLNSNYQIKFLSFGHAGVEIFFVLSGYIILRAHWGDPNSWPYFKRYVARRFTRIFPMTIVTVICLLALTPFLRSLTSDPLLFDISAIKIVTSLSLIPLQCEYIPGTLWSLSNEVFFYMIFAVYFIRAKTHNQ